MIPQTFYHIFNRINNRQPIFFSRDNYLYFLTKVRRHLSPHMHFIAYCLMPNHFHFLIYAKEDFEHEKFGNGLRTMFSSYTRAVYKREERAGSLFQQNTKIKPLADASPAANSTNYPFIRFHYIHQNPVKARLVKKMEDWEMSSFADYDGRREETLCNKTLAYDLLEIPEHGDLFLEQSEAVVFVLI